MTTVGAFEAKTHLSNLLERVQAGEEFVITRHGQEVALLVPRHKKPAVSLTIRALREFRQGRTLQGPSVREMIEEGRRF